MRKWLLNDLQQPLLLIRDPVLIFIYFRYMKLHSTARIWPALWAASVAMFAMLVTAQALTNPLPAPVYAIGLRNYLLYIPLAFVIRETFESEDITKLFKVALAISIPSAALVFIQFYSPPSAFINKGISSDSRGVFLVAADRVRPYGMFTFAAAQATFATAMSAILIVCWDQQKQFRVGKPLLWGGTFAAITMGALSGSRTFFGGAILVLLMYLLAAVTSRKLGKGAMRLIGALAIVSIFAAVFVVVFPESFKAMSDRQRTAERQEGSTIARGFRMMTDVGYSLTTAPVLGHGLGAGSNAGAFVASGGTAGDWSRLVNMNGLG
ncbi:hypothetical protein ACRAWD_22045 [Caulobacter segnis]